MTEQDQQLWPLFEVMDQLATLLTTETEMLKSGNLRGLDEVVADKSMYVHKYVHLAQGLLSSDSIRLLSPEARNALQTQTTIFLKMMEENEEALCYQQESHGVVIKLFQSALEGEIKAVTYSKSGTESRNHQKNPSLALNEKV